MRTEASTLDGLTAAQAEAVTSEARDLLIIAGAGSGKTRVLTQRIAHLVRDRGVPPASIWCCTFTRKAAKEMHHRLEWLLDDTSCSQLVLGTFHAVAYDLLTQWGHLIGYRQGHPLGVFDERAAEQVILQVCRDMGHIRGTGPRVKWAPGLSLTKIERWRETLATTGREPDDLPEFEAGMLRAVWNEYRDRMRQYNALDYGLTLLECLSLMRVPEMRAHLRATVQHLLVDELQDTDVLQHDLHAELCPPACFTGVGDPRQSIYGFRGARPDLMTARHPDASVVDLCECFRCAPEVVEAANKLIAHEPDNPAQPMVSAGEAAATSGVVQAMLVPMTDLPSLLLTLMNEHLYAPDEIAVLARTHLWLDEAERQVSQVRAIEYHRIGSQLSARTTEEASTVLSAVSLAANPDDDAAFIRLHRLMGITPEGLAAVRARAGRDHVPLLAAYRAAAEEVDAELHPLMGMLHADTDAADLARMVCRLLPPNPAVTSLIDLWGEAAGMTPADALGWHMSLDDDEQADTGDGVTLATIHGVKGGEWPVVVIIGACEGSLPMRRSDTDVDEERRLAYVAITRAREQVCIVVPTEHVGRFEDSDIMPSRFIAEAGLKLEVYP